MKSNLSYTTDTWPLDGYANVFQITSLTYGFWEEEKTNLTNYDSYSAGINLDAQVSNNKKPLDKLWFL